MLKIKYFESLGTWRMSMVLMGRIHSASYAAKPTARQQRAFKKWAYGRFNAWRATA